MSNKPLFILVDKVGPVHFALAIFWPKEIVKNIHFPLSTLLYQCVCESEADSYLYFASLVITFDNVTVAGARISRARLKVKIIVS